MNRFEAFSFFIWNGFSPTTTALWQVYLFFLKDLSLFEFFFAANIGVTLVYDGEHFRQPDLNDLNWMRDPTRDPKRGPITGIGEPFEKMYKIFYILDMNNNFILSKISRFPLIRIIFDRQFVNRISMREPKVGVSWEWQKNLNSLFLKNSDKIS